MTLEEEFWSWFLGNEAEFLHADPKHPEARERSFTRLEAALHKINPNLTFEFQTSGNPPRDFVISASGMRDAFDAVLNLTKTAPPLPHWNLIAFRPRRVGHGKIEMDGLTLWGRDLTFTLLDDSSKPGLRLFIPGYKEDDPTFKNIAYLFLDEALGEYDVETGLAFLRFHAPEDPTEGERHPFEKLPEMFDRLVAQLSGKTGKSN